MEKGWVIAGFVIVITLLLLVVPLRFGAFLGISQSPPGAGFQSASLGSQHCFEALELFDGTNVARVASLCGSLESEEAHAYAAENGLSSSGTCSVNPRADVNGDGNIGFADVLAVLANWGPCSDCVEDVNEDGTVGFADILIILADWHKPICQCIDTVDNDDDGLIDWLADPGCGSISDDDETDKTEIFGEYLQHSSFLPSQFTGSDFFGTSSSINTRYAAIGATASDVFGSNTGFVQILEFDGLHWNELQFFSAEPPLTESLFGGVLEFLGNDLGVGIFGTGYDGELYLYRLNTEGEFQHHQTIRSPESSRALSYKIGFARSFGSSGDLMLVGGTENEPGYVYPYYYNGGEWESRTEKLRVFVTNEEFDGNLGGIEGAHTICQEIADERGLGGVWNAWMSDSNHDARKIVTRLNGGYELLDGRTIADDWRDLTTCDGPNGACLQNPINVNEFGEHIESGVVWTATDNAGVYTGVGSDCEEWTRSNSGEGGIGLLSERHSNWTHNSRQLCAGNTARLYCFEQADRFTGSNLDYQRNLFGRSLSIYQDTAVISALPADSIGKGVAYVFEHDGNGWLEKQILSPKELSSGDNFGRALDISEHWIVVGAPEDDEFGINTGVVYIYRKEGDYWSNSHRLFISDPEDNDFVGRELSIEGNTLAVSVGKNVGGNNAAGAIYIYQYDSEKDEWIEEQIIVESIPERNNRFGSSITLHQDALIVGVPGSGEAGSGVGKAYVYSRHVCGDGVVNQPGEVCDDGENNGVPGFCNADCSDQSDATVFVTSEKWFGHEIGSLTDGDEKCSAAAAHAGISGNNWVAWLSDINTNAKDRITNVQKEYVLKNGKIVADNLNDLINCDTTCLQHSINVTEFGETVSSGKAWTGTRSNGESFFGLFNCGNWLDPEENGVTGTLGQVGGFWTEGVSDRCNNNQYHLYCFNDD